MNAAMYIDNDDDDLIVYHQDHPVTPPLYEDEQQQYHQRHLHAQHQYFQEPIQATSHFSSMLQTIWKFITGNKRTPDNRFDINNDSTSTTSWNNIGMAILVIILIQIYNHYPTIRNTIWTVQYTIRQDGLVPTLTDFMIACIELFKGYFQITCEIFRNIKQQYFSYLFWNYDSDIIMMNNQQPYMSNNHYIDNINDTFNDGQNHYDELPQPPRTASSTIGNLFSNTPFAHATLGPPPPLVVIEGNDNESKLHLSNNGDDHQHSRRSPSPSTSASSSCGSNSTIEPAFLNDEDYPPGWLVYHTVLGVVSKEEADVYDRQQQALKQQQQQQHHHHCIQKDPQQQQQQSRQPQKISQDSAMTGQKESTTGLANNEAPLGSSFPDNNRAVATATVNG